MAVDCSNVPNNLTYDCGNPWGQDCTSEKHFDFATLWIYTQNIQKACANDSRLFLPNGGNASPQNASLTQTSCAAIAGYDWTYYPAADIWTRLTTWKFPLLQLVASFPRPPLNFSVECFVILHLLGDPVDTMKNLLAKMSSCHDTAKDWRTKCEGLLDKPPGEDEDRDWKAMALITDAYGEWDEDGEAKKTLHRGLLDNPQRKKDLASAIRRTGRALAADRSTEFLPIIVAQAFFIGAVGIAIFRTASAAGSSASSDSVFINVEAHSIAFSALYFWIIPAVFLGSIIGVSQTEAAIPRILRRFQFDVDRLDLRNKVKLPNDCLDDNSQRIFHGGVYSWQPQRFHPSRTPWTCHNILPYLVVIMGTATGMTVSALVPPDGWDCRHNGEILIGLAWLLSARIDVWLSHFWLLNKDTYSKLFWVTAFKDLVITGATMGGVIATQVGIFNKCSCYTLWGKTGLALPEMPDVAQSLFYRLNRTYPAITFTCIGIQLIIIPLFICIRYRNALRTFVQRDDRKSNAKWLWKLIKRCQGLKAKFQTTLSRKPFGSAKGSRTNTLRVEEGRQGYSLEMLPLTRIVSAEPEEIAPVTDGELQTADSSSQSSGVDAPAGPGGKVPLRPDPRRRNTEMSRTTI